MIFFNRKKHDFYKLLRDQADITLEGLSALREFIDAPDPAKGMRVQDLEKQADEQRRILIDALNQSMVTPFDREDIFGLSRAVDDMIDYARSTVEEMMLFEVGTDPHLKKMAKAIHEGGQEIVAAVRLLHEHHSVVQEHIIDRKSVV